MTDGIIETKRCSRCGKAKSLREFSRDRRAKNGVGCWCRVCAREYGAAYREAYHKANRTYHIADRAIRREIIGRKTSEELAAIRKIYDNVINDEIVICSYCGKAIPKNERHVDHIISLAKGGTHTANNLMPACAKCNMRKGTKPAYRLSFLSALARP